MEKFCNALLAHLTGKWNKPTSCNTVKYSFALPARYYHVWQLEYTFIFPTMPQARLTEKNPWQVFISVVFSSRNFVPRLRLLPLDVYQLFALCLGLSNISNDTHDKRQSKHTQKMLKAERVNNEKHSQTKRCTASHSANKNTENKIKLCINARTQTENVWQFSSNLSKSYSHRQSKSQNIPQNRISIIVWPQLDLSSSLWEFKVKFKEILYQAGPSRRLCAKMC